MDFSLFAQSLYPFYDWSKDTESDRRKKGKRGPFVRSLLKAGLDAEGVNIIEDLKNDTMLKYYTGNRSVNQVMLDTNSHFDEEPFNDYIYEMFEWKFKEIRDEFQKHEVIIKPGNEVGSIVEIYVDIRNVQKKTKEPKEPISAPAQQKMLPKDQDAIADIILQLGSILDELKTISGIEDLLNWHHPTDYREHIYRIQACTVEGIEVESGLDVKTRLGTSSQIDKTFGCSADPESSHQSLDTFNDGSCQSPFSHKLTEFCGVNQKLLPYIERYPKYKLLFDLYRMGIEINAEYLFYRPADRNDGKTYHPYIDQYEKQLKACTRDILDPTFSEPPPNYEES